MLKFNLFCWLLLSVCSVFNVAANETRDTVKCNNFNALQWLVGEWQSQSDKHQLLEQWQVIDEQHMRGTGITISLNKKTPSVEFLEIIQLGEQIFYIAKPPQNPIPIAFALVECSEKRLKFVNVSHDFPTTIEYRYQSDNQLKALVSGSDGKGFSIEYTKKNNAVSDHIATVQTYVEAYNQRDLAAMLKHTTANIQWMSVAGDRITVETADQQALSQALQQHFKRPRKSLSSLSGISQYGHFVSAIEKVTATKGDTIKHQCSLSIYQFEGALIRSVWYYPAQSCQ